MYRFQITLDNEDDCLFTSDTIYYLKKELLIIYHYTDRCCTKYCEVPILLVGKTSLEVVRDGYLYYTNYGIDPDCSISGTSTIVKMDKYGNSSTMYDIDHICLIEYIFAYDNIWKLPFYGSYIIQSISEKDYIRLPSSPDIRLGSLRSDRNAFYYADESSIYQLHLDSSSTKLIDVKEAIKTSHFTFRATWEGKAFIVYSDLGLGILYSNGTYISIKKDYDGTLPPTDMTDRSFLYDYFGQEVVSKTWDLSDNGKCYDGRCIRLPDIKWSHRNYDACYDISIVTKH